MSGQNGKGNTNDPTTTKLSTCCSMSRSHATSTRRTDYLAVPEEAAPLLVAVECHMLYNLKSMDFPIEWGGL